MYIKLDAFKAAVAHANQATFDAFNAQPGPYAYSTPAGRFWQSQLDMYLDLMHNTNKRSVAQ